jgi:hypothetical protein
MPMVSVLLYVKFLRCFPIGSEFWFWLENHFHNKTYLPFLALCFVVGLAAKSFSACLKFLHWAKTGPFSSLFRLFSVT